MAETLWVHWETANLFQPTASPLSLPAKAGPTISLQFVLTQITWLVHSIASIPFVSYSNLSRYAIATTWDYITAQILSFSVLGALLYATQKQSTKSKIVFSFCVLSLGLWGGCYLTVLRSVESRLDSVNTYAGVHCTSWIESISDPAVKRFWEEQGGFMSPLKTSTDGCNISNLTDWGNHPFSVINGSLWVIGLVWTMLVSGFTPRQRILTHLPAYLNKGPLLLALLSLLQVYTWAPFVTLWLFASELALSAIFCYAITSQPGFKNFFKISPFTAKAEFKHIRCLFALTAVTVDATIWLGGYPSPFWKLCLEAGLAIWAIFWFLKMTSAYKNMLPENAFIIYSLGQCTLLATVAKLQHMFFFEHMPYVLAATLGLYLMPVICAYAQVPEFAVETHRRITMFSEPPAMEFEPTLFPTKQHSSDVFWCISTLCTSLWFFAGVGVTCHTIFCDKVFFISGLALTMFAFAGVWSAFQVSSATSTSETLNWRGLFLAFHEHNWVVRYVLNYTVLLLLALTAIVIFGIFPVSACYFTNNGFKSIWLFVVLVWAAAGLMLPFLRMWASLLSYFELFTSEDWTEGFWKKMSPYLRDLVYWRPVQPDSYVPPRPFYAGFDRKISMRLVLIVVWGLVVLALFIWLRMLNSDHAQAGFAYVVYATIVYLLFLKTPRFRDDVSLDVRNLRDYVFFERLVHVVFAICINFGVFYLLYSYEWGLFAFIAYWIWQVR